MFGLGVGWTSLIIIAIIVAWVWCVSVVSRMNDEGHGDGGCGCLLVVTAIAVILVFLMIRGCINEKQSQDEIETNSRLEGQKRRSEGVKQREREKEECVRVFWEREKSSVWDTYQRLKAYKEATRSKNSELVRKLKLYGRKYEGNDVYQQNLSVISNIENREQELWRKMEDAYLKSEEFKAAPNTSDNEILNGLLKDAIQEAEADENKFRWMREQK